MNDVKIMGPSQPLREEPNMDEGIDDEVGDKGEFNGVLAGVDAFTSENMFIPSPPGPIPIPFPEAPRLAKSKSTPGT